jgi:hypothetical protein
MIGRLVAGESGLRTQPEAAAFRSFFDHHPVPEAKRDLARTWERIQNNISFLAKAQTGIYIWLESQYSEKPHFLKHGD